MATQPKFNKENKSSNINIEDRAEFKENDNISHFICRLAYCRNEELRKWFIT
jgi:DNA primase large subunit